VFGSQANVIVAIYGFLLCVEPNRKTAPKYAAIAVVGKQSTANRTTKDISSAQNVTRAETNDKNDVAYIYTNCILLKLVKRWYQYSKDTPGLEARQNAMKHSIASEQYRPPIERRHSHRFFGEEWAQLKLAAVARRPVWIQIHLTKSPNHETQ